MQEALYSQLYNYALYLLSRREYSRQKMALKLDQRIKQLSRDVPDILANETTNALLFDLQQKGYLSDKRYVDAYFRAKIRQLDGPEKIRAGLYQHNIASDLWQQVVLDNAVDWGELCRELYQKRYGNTFPSNPKEKHKRQRYLLSKGYSFEHINHCLAVIKSGKVAL